MHTEFNLKPFSEESILDILVYIYIEEENINMNLVEIGCVNKVWIHLA
jgi:hypothetical protein